MRTRLLTTALLLTMAAVAHAQPGLGGAGGLADRFRGSGSVLLQFLLLDQPSVQAELRVNAEQLQRARDLAARQRAQLEGLGDLPQEEALRKLVEAQRAADRGLKEILSESQFRRLREITLQQAGPMSLSRADIAEAVGLSAEQQQRVRQIQEQLWQSLSQEFQGGAGGRGLAGALGRVQEVRQGAEAKVLGLLTAEQKARWDRLQGTPFEGEIHLGPGLGNRPRLGGRLRRQ